jgi:hypothetical protein
MEQPANVIDARFVSLMRLLSRPPSPSINRSLHHTHHTLYALTTKQHIIDPSSTTTKIDNNAFVLFLVEVDRHTHSFDFSTVSLYPKTKHFVVVVVVILPSKMKLVSTVAFAVFLASSSTEAFGPAAQIRATPFGQSNGATLQSGSSMMTMNIGHQDLKRKQRILRIIDGNPTRETVQDVLLSEATSATIEKCNWKLRQSLLRKVNKQAQRYGITVDPKFGVP